MTRVGMQDGAVIEGRCQNCQAEFWLAPCAQAGLHIEWSCARCGAELDLPLLSCHANEARARRYSADFRVKPVPPVPSVLPVLPVLAGDDENGEGK